MNEKLTLSELQLIIRDSLYMALPDMYWVIAEISELKQNHSGHCYLELIEKQADDKNIRARVKAVMWSSKYRFLRSFFENITGESLREGLKVLIKVKIEYHEIYGLSLVVSDIDPSFTIGELAVKRQMIIKKLEDEGVLNMNPELDFPLLPQRIAVISSVNAAGYHDFIKHLKENNYGYVFYTALFEASMQGNETEASVTGAIDRIAANIGFFDTVVIIRGGGSQTDLSWFDNYNIAYYVTQIPVPVLTGIGHEKDMSVTDIVAYRALKTPTAVADFLIGCMNDTEIRLTDAANEIVSLTGDTLREFEHRLDTFRMRITPLAKVMISETREKLSETIIEMINTGKECILRAGLIPANHKSRLLSLTQSMITDNKTTLSTNRRDLLNLSKDRIHYSNLKVERLSDSLKILDPVNVLKRGFTVTSVRGKILKSALDVKIDDDLKTDFSDGSVNSRVTGCFEYLPKKRQAVKDKKQQTKS